jgi:RNA polymerase sigma-70 factor (ECF subfamily)
VNGAGTEVKQARAVSWLDVDGREAALVQRCANGDEVACADLVAEHQRMVVQLAINLLGDRDEALDLSQEVFLRVFRTIHGFRGQSSLRTWIYRIAVNQARNRHRFWSRRHRADQVSLDEHVAAHGSSCRAASRRRIRSSRRRSWRAGFTRLDSLPFDQRTAIVLRKLTA